MITRKEAGLAQNWLDEHHKDRLHIFGVPPTGHEPGLRQIVDIQRSGADILFRQAVVLVLGRWAIDNNIDLLASVSKAADTFVGALHRQEQSLPMASFRRINSALEVFALSDARAERVLKEGGRVGLVIDELSSGDRLLDFAAEAPLGAGSALQAIAIVDRGQDVPGVKTRDEALIYSYDHPFEPPAHIRLPFDCKTIIDYPWPRFEPFTTASPSGTSAVS